jgi:xanthine/uracil permease
MARKERRVPATTRNLLPAAVALTIDAGNFQITMGIFTLSSIGVATIAAIMLYQILREKAEPEEQAMEIGPEG